MINRLKTDRELRSRLITLGALIINCVYATSNIALGLTADSVWFVTLGAYYLVLSIMRAVCIRRLSSPIGTRGTLGFVGVMLTILCATLMGSVILSFEHDKRGVASLFVLVCSVIYTFFKLVLAVRNAWRAHKRGRVVWVALRNISCADAAASVLSVERLTILTLFDMEGGKVAFVHIATAVLCCSLVLFLGVSSIMLSFLRR